MRDRSVAFMRATQALSQLGLPGELPELKKNGVFLRRSVLGGSHSVATYPPLAALAPISVNTDSHKRYGETVNLYIHIPFCEAVCTFCHYAVEKHRSDRVPRYMQALGREIESWGSQLRDSGTKISSLYIGGGTPLTLTSEELEKLFRSLKRAFTFLPGMEICVEGSPSTIMAKDGYEKLELLRRFHVTRFSFGVQSFSQPVLKAAARASTEGTEMLAARRVASIFRNWNLDLIQSLYDGSPEEVWSNIDAVLRLNPPHLTWYHGRFADRPQGRWRIDPVRKEHFEQEEETLLGRMLIWQELERAGYQMIDGNRFVIKSRYVDPFKRIRTSVHEDLLGIGVASYSHVHGRFFRNHASIGTYIEAMENGGPSISSGMELTPSEYLAASYALGLRGVRIETNETRRLRTQEPALSAHYDALTERLVNLGLLETVTSGEQRGLQLTKKGRLFEDETLFMFFSPEIQARINKQ